VPQNFLVYEFGSSPYESNRASPTGGRRPLPFKRDLMDLSLSLPLSLSLSLSFSLSYEFGKKLFLYVYT
jgi:hypothetical protein